LIYLNIAANAEEELCMPDRWEKRIPPNTLPLLSRSKEVSNITHRILSYDKNIDTVNMHNLLCAEVNGFIDQIILYVKYGKITKEQIAEINKIFNNISRTIKELENEIKKYRNYAIKSGLKSESFLAEINVNIDFTDTFNDLYCTIKEFFNTSSSSKNNFINMLESKKWLNIT